jgi:hypothetical protein
MKPATLVVEVGDVVAVPSLGNGKTFRVTEIRSDGRVSGPAVSIRRSREGEVGVSEIKDSYFHGFDPRLVELLIKGSLNGRRP